MPLHLSMLPRISQDMHYYKDGAARLKRQMFAGFDSASIDAEGCSG